MKKIDALNFLTNSNFETTNFAAAAPAKSGSAGKFRFFMHSAGGNAQSCEESVPDKRNLLMFSMLGRNQQGEMLNIKTKITGIGGENGQEDSRCPDSELMELIDGIVGIIEGFGLLDYNMDESVIDEMTGLIASAVDSVRESASENPEKAYAAAEDFIKELSEIIARMPNAENSELLAQEAQEALKKLFGEYQCSFDNTNSTGVEQIGLEKATEQPSEKARAATDTAGKIKIMLKIAAAKSEGKEIKSPGLNDRKPWKAEKSTSGQEKQENTVHSKIPPEASVTQETNQNQSIESVPQDDMDENVVKIADKIVMSQTEGKKEFDISLKPSFLGKLSIKLTMEGDSIKAHIKAADQYVKGLISEQLPELSQALKEKGVNMSHIEVVYESPMQMSADRQFNGHGADTGGTGKGWKLRGADKGVAESIVFGSVTDETDLFLKNSSVEFSA